VHGSELVTNGTFDTNLDGWTPSTTGSGQVTWVNGTASLYSINGLNTATLSQSISITAGKTYRVLVTLTGDAGVCGVSIGGGSAKTGLNVGSNVVYLVAGSSNTNLLFTNTSNLSTVNIDNVSVKLLPGNHRFQTTSANRPVVSARVNLLTKTEQFDDAVWSKFNLNAFGSGSVANTTATLDPLGGNTADFIQENTATGSHGVGSASVSMLASVPYTVSVYVKAAGRTKVQVWSGSASPRFQVVADLTANTVTPLSPVGTATNISSSISNVGNGWYHVICTGTTGTDGSYGPAVILDNGTGNSYTGDGTSGIYIWGADLRPTNQGVGLPAYQRVNTSTDYDSTGFPVYIKPNGSNQFMQTNSINFTATDKMTVWQGVRKLSDSGIATFTELSTNGDVNPGIFSFAAPVNSTTYQFALRGATALSCRQPTTPIFAPVTSVIATNYKLSETAANEITVRFNANAIALSTASSQPGPAGAGNFGNYPAYFYSRAGSTFFSSANDYGSIARGAASTAAQITNGETYINSLTKAYAP
jgi:hypothetical protein